MTPLKPENEGVIKFSPRFKKRPIEPNVSCQFETLKFWRRQTYQDGWIGQDPARYDGAGFGNISLRATQGNPPEFIITESQTGHLESLCDQNIAWITSFDLKSGSVTYSSDALPSSESMSHAAVYASNPNMNACIHVHCPRIWNAQPSPTAYMIPETIAYGTLEMVTAINKVMAKTTDESSVLMIMKGHLDGVLCAGKDAATAYGHLKWAHRT